MIARESGSARSATTSIQSAAATRFSSTSTWDWTRGRCTSTARGVKARLTVSRSRVWCGGSRKSIDCRWPPVAGQLASVRPAPALVAADPPPIPK